MMGGKGDNGVAETLKGKGENGVAETLGAYEQQQALQQPCEFEWRQFMDW